MDGNSILQIAALFSCIGLLIKPLGLYMATVYERKPCFLDNTLKPVEIWFYKIATIDPEQEMNWKEYACSMLIFNFFGFLALYALQRLQIFLPLNPETFSSPTPDLAFNTAVSFITNANWQAYSGENSLSYLTQMLGLTVQNFLSAATGMSILIAFIRGLQRRETSGLGNFWVDTLRCILYVLLPLSILFAILLASEGVIQNLNDYQKIELTEKIQYTEENPQKPNAAPQTKILTEQLVPMGPVASQVAIKQLGTNGGGFFGANSAHPFENPTPFSNFLEMLAILLIPASLCYTYGVMIKNRRQGLAILATMFLLLIPPLFIDITLEKNGTPNLSKINDSQVLISNGNLEGKETRFGPLSSALWATITTATANGSVNASLDSFTPLGGLISMWLIDLGEVIFGGVGSGLYQMLLFIIIAVFVSGLMVGRTPEYLGKKIEAYEIKMASFAIIVMPITVLTCTAICIVLEVGQSAISNPGAHGFTEILYAFSSMANNNGSAFAGLNANTPFFNTVGGIAILMGRYWIAIPVLAIAGSLARKKTTPFGPGTLPTDSPLFIAVLIGVIVIIGALIFFPAFSLGPIIEHLMIVNP